MRAIVLGLALALLGPGVCAGIPIRGNTPGPGVVQGSGILSGVVVDRQSGREGDLLTWSFVTELRYAPSTHWVFGVRVPYVERSLDRPGLGRVSVSGLGDVIVTGKHRFFRQVGAWSDRHAAIELGVKLPTGDDGAPDPRLPGSLRSRLQPGSGSTDLLVDLVYQQARGRWGYAGDLGYRANSEAGGYRAGAEARLNAGLQYILLPRVYTEPGHELFVLLEGALVGNGEDRFRGGLLPETGRTELLLAPGLQYVATEQLFLDFSVQFPVYADVEQGGSKSRWNALVQLRYAF